MNTRQLAARMGVARSRVTVLEQAEVHGTVTLKTLREAAEAMDCMLFYAIVPKAPLEDILRARATSRAEAELARIHHTMGLENQALTERDLAAERQRMIAALANSSPRRLWDDP